MKILIVIGNKEIEKYSKSFADKITDLYHNQNCDFVAIPSNNSEGILNLTENHIKACRVFKIHSNENAFWYLKKIEKVVRKNAHGFKRFEFVILGNFNNVFVSTIAFYRLFGIIPNYKIVYAPSRLKKIFKDLVKGSLFLSIIIWNKPMLFETFKKIIKQILFNRKSSPV